MSTVLDVDAENWEKEVLQSDILTVVDFWHERCPWCIRFNPVLEEVAEEYKGKVKFVRFNVLKTPENRRIALENGVMATPTIAFYCDGRYLGSMVGFMPRERLKLVINEFIERHGECVKQSTKLEI